jgi:hypothetical protein
VALATVVIACSVAGLSVALASPEDESRRWPSMNKWPGSMSNGSGSRREAVTVDMRSSLGADSIIANTD